MKLAQLLVLSSSLESHASLFGAKYDSNPVVTVRNGTLRGLHLPDFEEDLFLGIPFAEPPTGDLRLRHPIPYQSTWAGTRDATVRGLSCSGYTDPILNLSMGEDCLKLDIVRPSGFHDASLPVLVWVYGGGYVGGSSADEKYNTSYLVNKSVAMEKPMIAVSINYRISGWGFLASKEMVADDAANIGLWDQHLALKWINENIAAFGGDPSRVTFMGESAGGWSVGFHLVAFDGNNGGLFRAAILESGTALSVPATSISDMETTWQPIYDNITATVGCANSSDTLSCLRTVPFEALDGIFGTLFYFAPIIDGNFLVRSPSESLALGKTADVALLLGTNTDEGTADFFGIRGWLDTDADVARMLGRLGRLGGLTYGDAFNDAAELDGAAVARAMALYPDDPALGCPFGSGPARFPDQGLQFKRGAAIVGDQRFHAGRRATARHYARLPPERRRPVYSYRFDQATWNGIMELITTTAPVGVPHFAEVSFVFTIDPVVSEPYENWIGPYPDYYVLSDLMARSWIAFVDGLDPNGHGIEGAVVWPEYAETGENIVFRVNETHVERDNWREPQLAFWFNIWSQLK